MSHGSEQKLKSTSHKAIGKQREAWDWVFNTHQAGRDTWLQKPGLQGRDLSQPHEPRSQEGSSLCERVFITFF